MNYAGVLVVGTIVLAGSQSVAMPQCGDRDVVIGRLTNDCAEANIASGLQSDTGLMEVWASDSGDSWTIPITGPDGRTCVVAAGTHWLSQDGIEVAQGDPA